MQVSGVDGCLNVYTKVPTPMGVDTFVRVGGLECKCEVREKKYHVQRAHIFFFSSKNYTTIEHIKCIIHMLANQFVSVVRILHIK